ncbi:pentapeptide repeat-containing protein [Kitasatospora sp. NPDC056184]|uniref:pentapeptide repeat-containing protein n=1 Tax=Kitasatospora sp. NPDC056184 TaxID=3345738 RepID=UPI0035DAF427
MSSADCAAYLGTLAAGSDLDFRGTSIDEHLLNALLAACTDLSSGKPRFGETDFTLVTFTGAAWFDSAIFNGNARFDSATFTRAAVFDSATFEGDVRFDSATFTGNAVFDSATFTRAAWFGLATFAGKAVFDSATFTRDARFHSATFEGDAWFDSAAFNGAALFDSAAFTDTAVFDSAAFNGRAWFHSATFTSAALFDSATFTGEAVFDSSTFNGEARFHSATFEGEARFHSATFEGSQQLGPMVGVGGIGFDSARFAGPQVTIEGAASDITFERAVFEGSAVLRLRYATVLLSSATLSAPVSLQAWPVPFTLLDGSALDESILVGDGADPGIRLTSLRGVDAARLVLTDVDLSRCQFTGAFHLNQIQIGFGCRFAAPPAGWRRRGALPVRWSRRKVLAEERHWRAQVGGVAGRGWPAGQHHGEPGLGAGPDDLVGVYQQLRKAFEEAGNEPGAADFYYGEMEMRRRDVLRPRAERRLLGVYWLASGYGLRASRALSWLLAAMGAALLLLVLFGLPDDTPNPRTEGAYGAGVVATTKAPDPVLSLPWSKRVTAKRAEKAALVVVDSMVFRSSGQHLTLAGTVIETASRIGEPVLLGLAALAVRGRVKR